MTVYFSPKNAAFYDDAIFGARTIDVIDEEAQDEAVAKAAARDAKDFEKALEAIDGESDARPLRRDFQERQRAAEASPIMKTVANPDCRLPADAVQIDPAEHARLLAEQAAGREIVAGSNGLPLAQGRTVSGDELLSQIRRERDRQLAATDWTQTGDSPLSAAKKALWAEHRKALRDLPKLIEATLKKGGAIDLQALFPVAPGADG